MSQVNNLITGQWQWVAVLSIATRQKEKESSNVTCTTTPKQQTYVRFFFFTLSLETCHRDIKSPNEKQKGCECVRSSSQEVSLKTVSNEVQTKAEKWKLQLSQQPSLTLTHITSLIIFNIYTDVHKIHSKRRFFFFSSFSTHFKSSCTFRAIRRKRK